MRQLIILIILPFTLASCFQEKKQVAAQAKVKHFLEYAVPKETYTPGVYDGNPEPPYPDLEEDVKTLEGIDADKDGLRDDLEIWINRNSKDQNERNLWRQDVRMRTDTISSNDNDVAKGLQYLRSGAITVACGSLLFAENFEEMFDRKSRLIDYVANTKKRESYYLRTTNKASPYHGGFATHEEILLMSRCFCRFEIKDKQNVLERYQAYLKIFVNLTQEKINLYLDGFKVRNERGYYEDFFGISDYKSCLDIKVKPSSFKNYSKVAGHV